jgi:hypothetical protein
LQESPGSISTPLLNSRIPVVNFVLDEEELLLFAITPNHGAAARKAGSRGQERPCRAAACFSRRETLTQRLTIYLDDNPVDIIAPGPGHTMGDVYMFFPNQRSLTLATHGPFLNADTV